MKQLHKQWASILIRGIFSALFGILAIFYPGIGLEVLVLVFGAYALVDGIIALVVGAGAKSWLLLLEGVLGIFVGAYVFFYTAQATLLFLLLVGIWALMTGILEIVAAIELRKIMKHEIWLLLVGISSIVFGILVFVNPLVAGYAFTLVIGIYALMFGSFLIALGMKVKNYAPSPAKKKRK